MNQQTATAATATGIIEATKEEAEDGNNNNRNKRNNLVQAYLQTVAQNAERNDITRIAHVRGIRIGIEDDERSNLKI